MLKKTGYKNTGIEVETGINEGKKELSHVNLQRAQYYIILKDNFLCAYILQCRLRLRLRL
jgi:hypothetical protein